MLRARSFGKAKLIMTLAIACIALTKSQMALLAHQPPGKAGALYEIIQRLSPESDWELEEIMGALAKAAEIDIGCKVFVIDVPFANAITLPTGEILITEPLLSLLQTADEVAFVLAHELAHAIRGDAKRIPYASITLSEKPPLEPDVDRTFITEGLRAVATLIRAVYSQELELSADELAIKLMAKAGFDAKASLSVLERLSRSEATAACAWLSTHPGAAQRLQRLTALRIPEPQHRAAIQPPRDMTEVVVDLDIQIPWCNAALTETIRGTFNECLSEQLKGTEVGLKLAKPWQRRRAKVLLVRLSLVEQQKHQMSGMKGWLIWTQRVVASVYTQPEMRVVKCDELELIAVMREDERSSDVMRWRLKGIACWLAKVTYKALSEALLRGDKKLTSANFNGD